MTIYVNIPGQHQTQVIVPDNFTLAQFAERAQKVTGCSIFAGIQPLGQGTVQTSPYESHITNASIYNVTQATSVSLTTTSLSATLSSIFNNGDTIQILNVPIGG